MRLAALDFVLKRLIGYGLVDRPAIAATLRKCCDEYAREWAYKAEIDRIEHEFAQESV